MDSLSNAAMMYCRYKQFVIGFFILLSLIGIIVGIVLMVQHQRYLGKTKGTIVRIDDVPHDKKNQHRSNDSVCKSYTSYVFDSNTQTNRPQTLFACNFSVNYVVAGKKYHLNVRRADFSRSTAIQFSVGTSVEVLYKLGKPNDAVLSLLHTSRRTIGMWVTIGSSIGLILFSLTFLALSYRWGCYLQIASDAANAIFDPS